MFKEISAPPDTQSGSLQELKERAGVNRVIVTICGFFDREFQEFIDLKLKKMRLDALLISATPTTIERVMSEVKVDLIICGSYSIDFPSIVEACGKSTTFALLTESPKGTNHTGLDGQVAWPKFLPYSRKFGNLVSDLLRGTENKEREDIPEEEWRRLSSPPSEV